MPVPLRLPVLLLVLAGCPEDTPKPPAESAESGTDTPLETAGGTATPDSVETALAPDTGPGAESGADTGTEPTPCAPSQFAMHAQGFTEWRLDGEPGQPVLTDLDGDGFRDLALLVGEEILLSMGAGDLGLEDPDPVPLGGPFVDLAAADMEGDGLTDLVLLSGDGVVHVATALAPRTWSPPEAFWVTDCWSVLALEMGDLDGDLEPDPFVACTDGRYQVRTSTLGTVQDGTVTGALDTVLPADWDQDGDPDFLLGGASNTTLDLLLNEGDGILRATSVPVPAPVYLVGAGDLDGDGDPDLAISLGDDNDLVWLRNDGAGSFSSKRVRVYDDTYDSTWLWATGLVLSDLDGDGTDDVLAYTNRMSWTFFGTPAGPEGHEDEWGWYQVMDRVALGDLTGDGLPDAVVASDDGWVTARLGNGTGRVATPAVLVDEDLLTFSSHAFVDLDGDRHQDLVACAWGSLAYYLQDPESGAFSRSCAWEASFGFEVFAAGDVDGDGDEDVVAGDTYVKDRLLVLRSDGAGCVEEATVTTLSTAARSSKQIVLADLDGDGDLDVTLDLHGNPRLRTLLNDGTGAFALHQDLEVDRELEDMALGEFNGDGSPDLAFYDDPDAEVAIAFGDGAGSFGAPNPIPIFGRTVAFLAADFNEDGLDDLLLAAEHGGPTLLLNDGDGTTFASVAVVPELGSPGALAAGLDGDGHLDILTWDEIGSDSPHLLAGDGAGGFVDAGLFQEQGAGHQPILGDREGDGDLDLGFFLTGSSAYAVGILDNPCGG